MTCWRTLGQVGAEADEHLGGHAFALAHEPEEHVLGADVVVAELQGLAQRELQDLLRPGRERRGAGRRRARQADGLLDLLAHRFERDPELLERLGGNALALVDQAEKDVLGADEAVVEQARFLLREYQHSPRPISKAFEHQTASLDGSNPEPSLPGMPQQQTPRRPVSAQPNVLNPSLLPAARRGDDPDLNLAR